MLDSESQATADMSPTRIGSNLYRDRRIDPPIELDRILSLYPCFSGAPSVAEKLPLSFSHRSNTDETRIRHTASQFPVVALTSSPSIVATDLKSVVLHGCGTAA